MSKKKQNKEADNIFQYLNNHVYAINNSKLFAGLMIIILNISSKFVNIKLSKTMESYLKYTFSRDILVFAIAWMGTRDIYIALIITSLFIICVEYVFNEDSMFCCLSENFTNHHVSLLDSNEIVTPEDIKKAEATLARAKEQATKSPLDTLGKTLGQSNSNGVQFQKFTSY
jgi:hypothetical protein